MKHTFLVSSLAIIMAGFLFQTPKTSKSALAKQSNNYQVELSSSGFSPSIVTVQQGNVITFKNVDTANHWPASNIHPTHDVYPEFDPQSPVKPGDSWQISLQRVGEWRYHDHLHPEKNGTVIVTADPKGYPVSNSKSISPLITLKALYASLKIKVYERYYRLKPDKKTADLAQLDVTKLVGNNQDVKLATAIKLYGPEAIMTKLSIQANNGIAYDCHLSAHHVGKIAYQVAKEAVLFSSNYDCRSGYIHGAIAAYINSTGTENLIQRISTVCEKGGTLFVRLQCYHGLGHGVMAYQNNDVPAAIQSCNTLENRSKTRNCLAGTFMENIATALNPTHATKWIDKSDPLVPCTKVDQAEEVQSACYIAQARWILIQNKFDISKTAALCQQAPSEAVTSCYFGLGFQISLLKKPIAEVAASCLNLTTNAQLQLSCVNGAQMSLLTQPDGENSNHGAKICLTLPEKLKESCLSGARIHEFVTTTQ